LKNDNIDDAVKSIMETSHLFRTLDDEGRRQMLECSRLIEFEAGNEIIREGSTGEGFYIIQHGNVEVSIERNCRKVFLAKLGPGAVVGEISLLAGVPRTATVTSLESSSAVYFCSDKIRDIIEDNAKVKQLLDKLKNHRAVDTVEKIIRDKAIS